MTCKYARGTEQCQRPVATTKGYCLRHASAGGSLLPAALRGTTGPTDDIRARLEELRAAIRAENISYGELAELQGLADHIDRSDVELLEWAGVPEHEEES